MLVVGGGGSSVGRAGSPLGFGGCNDNPDCHCVVIWVVMDFGVVVRREVATEMLDTGGETLAGAGLIVWGGEYVLRYRIRCPRLVRRPPR